MVRGVGPIESADILFGEGRDPKLADVHILVGTNGSGKTSLLAAIAACLADEAVQPLVQRARHDGAGCAIEGDYGSAACFRVPTNGQVEASFSGRRMTSYRTLRYGDVTVLRGSYDTSPAPTGLASYGDQAQSAVLTGANPTKFSFAAFAYSSYRIIRASQLTTIEAPAENPLAGSLDASSSQDAERLVRWIAASKTQEALARTEGNEEEARQAGAALSAVEQLVSKVAGAAIRFRLLRRPLRVTLSLEGADVGLDVLPDGLRAMLSWIGDLLLRLDKLSWEVARPVNEQPFLLLLDEVEAHLHPAWQRKLLPAVQQLFPNAQIVVSTHSPFVIGSVDEAWIYVCEKSGTWSTIRGPLKAQLGHSYVSVLRDIQGIPEEFDPDSEAKLDRLYDLRRRCLAGDESAFDEFRRNALELARRSPELNMIASRELAQVERLRAP